MSCLRERISLIGWVIDGWFGCYGMFGMIKFYIAERCPYDVTVGEIGFGAE